MTTISDRGGLALAGNPETAALALGRLRELANRNRRGHDDWATAFDMITALESQVVWGDRGTTRAQETRDEIASIVRRALPSSVSGSVLVAECRTRRWPLLGRRPRVVSVQQPTSSGFETRWQHSQGPAPFQPGEVRRLNRLVRRLERRGVFSVTMRHQGAVEANAWMTAQPPFTGAADRLALTVDPPLFQEEPGRPTPTAPLRALHHIADALQHAQSENGAVAEIYFTLDMIGWNLPPAEPESGGRPGHRPRPRYPLDTLHTIADILNASEWDETTMALLRLTFAYVGWELDEPRPSRAHLPLYDGGEPSF